MSIFPATDVSARIAEAARPLRGPIAGATTAPARPKLATPDIQFHFQPLSADKPGLEMHPFSGITMSVCQLRPESRGRIAIRSPDAAAHPAIQPN